MRARNAPLGGIALVAALVFGLVAVPSSIASAADYPSWDEVEAARASTAASAAASSRIDSLLDDLQLRANQAGEQAVTAGSLAGEAAQAERDASLRAQTLADGLARASEKANEGRDQLGRIAAQLYRSGSSDMARVFLADQPDAGTAAEGGSDALLMQLGTAARVSQIAASLRETALGEQRLVSTLTADARSAQRERVKLAAEAESARVAAETAVARADAELKVQQDAADTLYAQLAVLRNSTADIERSYRAGVAEAASYAAQKAAAEKAAADAAANPPGSGGGSGGSSGSGGTGSSPGSGSAGGGVGPGTNPGTTPDPAPDGAIVDPAAARAYAATAVAQRGWGTEQFDCLVNLWNRESRWRVDAHNPSSGAYGIPQAYPGSKMSSAGADWRTNAATQINWGLGYISGRYSNPCGAWAHSEDRGWY